jgi:hypothetical protein
MMMQLTTIFSVSVSMLKLNKARTQLYGLWNPKTLMIFCLLELLSLTINSSIIHKDGVCIAAVITSLLMSVGVT